MINIGTYLMNKYKLGIYLEIIKILYYIVLMIFKMYTFYQLILLLILMMQVHNSNLFVRYD